MCSALIESNVFFCPCSVRFVRPENNPFCNSGLLSMAKVMAQSTIPYGEAILNTVDTGGFVDKRRRMAVVRDVAEGPETLAGQRMASEFDGKERRAVKNVRLYSKVFFHLAFFSPSLFIVRK